MNPLYAGFHLGGPPACEPCWQRSANRQESQVRKIQRPGVRDEIGQSYLVHGCANQEIVEDDNEVVRCYLRQLQQTFAMPLRSGRNEGCADRQRPLLRVQPKVDRVRAVRPEFRNRR